MACHEYKITVEYVGGLLWDVSVWQREVGVDRTRTGFSCILSYQTATLEGHMPSKERLRQVLRTLGT